MLRILRASQSAANQTKRSQPTVITPAPAWRWPTGGQIYLRFGESQKTESGIRVAGRNGQPVVAAAGGEVVYAGSDLASYGNLLIIKHNESW